MKPIRTPKHCYLLFAPEELNNRGILATNTHTTTCLTTLGYYNSWCLDTGMPRWPRFWNGFYGPKGGLRSQYQSYSVGGSNLTPIPWLLHCLLSGEVANKLVRLTLLHNLFQIPEYCICVKLFCYTEAVKTLYPKFLWLPKPIQYIFKLSAHKHWPQAQVSYTCSSTFS